jgi:hypothetical protein
MLPSGPFLRHAATGATGLAVLVGIGWLLANTEGPWDRGASSGGGSAAPREELAIVVGMDRSDLPRPDWVAKKAEIGIRADERREGLTINHRVLVLHEAERPQRVLSSSSTLVYTPATELEGRVNDVIDGTIPVNPGMEAMFAIGRLVEARIVRLDGQGKVRAVEDARVSFVTVTRAVRPE